MSPKNRHCKWAKQDQANSVETSLANALDETLIPFQLVINLMKWPHIYLTHIQTNMKITNWNYFLVTKSQVRQLCAKAQSLVIIVRVAYLVSLCYKTKTTVVLATQTIARKSREVLGICINCFSSTNTVSHNTLQINTLLVSHKWWLRGIILEWIYSCF